MIKVSDYYLKDKGDYILYFFLSSVQWKESTMSNPPNICGHGIFMPFVNSHKNLCVFVFS